MADLNSGARKERLVSLNKSLMQQYRNELNKRGRLPEGDEANADFVETPLDQQQQQQDNSNGALTGNRSSSPPQPTDPPTSTPNRSGGGVVGGKKKRPRTTVGDTAVSDGPTSTRAAGAKSAGPMGFALGGGSSFLASRPSLRLSDLAGLEPVIAQIRELVFYPILYTGLYSHLGIRPPCGILLHGPSGCGKTSLAHAIAGELNLPFFKASGPELVGGTSGESEERIRRIFDAAVENAPSVLFIDSLDVIAGKKDASSARGMDRRIIAQLFDSIDIVSSLGGAEKDEDATAGGLMSASSHQQLLIDATVSSAVSTTAVDEGGLGNAVGDGDAVDRADIDGGNNDKAISERRNNKHRQRIVVLIVATNKPDSIDPGVRGRFSREIALPVPDAAARSSILSLLSKPLRKAPSVDLVALGKLTPGFVGADLKALIREAGMLAVSRIVHKGEQETEDEDGFSSGSGSGGIDVNGTEIHYNNKNSTIDGISGARKRSNSLSTVRSFATLEAAAQQLLPDGCVIDTVGRAISSTGSGDSGAGPMIPGNNNNNNTAANATISAAASDGVVAGAGDAAPHSWRPEEAMIEMSDFLTAVKGIQPTAKREGFAVAPDVSWNDVGALSEVRDELLHNVLEPIAHPERFRSLGLEVPAGVLFFGPPGCGKTLLAKALANQSGANFISVKGPELLNMFVGESESRVRQVFSRARASAPCTIFFDELDALCPKRSSGGEGGGGGGSGVTERVVNQLLTELDGLEARKDVYVIAATNRLELIDDAMLRPGRLGKLLYVPLPTAEDRVGILTALTRKLAIDIISDADLAAAAAASGVISNVDKVNIKELAFDARADGFTGADLAALLREAGLAVIREMMQKDAHAEEQQKKGTPLPFSSSSQSAVSTGTLVKPPLICKRHFEAAFQKSRPSVSAADRYRYDLVQQNLKSGMSALQALAEAQTEASTAFRKKKAGSSAIHHQSSSNNNNNNKSNSHDNNSNNSSNASQSGEGPVEL